MAGKEVVMPIITDCQLCQRSAAVDLDGVCSSCREEIANGQRQGQRVKRNDCPLHPGKTIWCRAFGSRCHEIRSTVCQRHYWRARCDEIHQETIRKLREIKETQKTKGPPIFFGQRSVLGQEISSPICCGGQL